jgi:hypothetical protein
LTLDDEGENVRGDLPVAQLDSLPENRVLKKFVEVNE